MVQSACLGVLVLLLIYTLWLMRSGRLNAHITVRWVLAECAAILAVLLWGRLPFITYTSELGDRELLVVLGVVLFGFFAFLTLDCLARISTHTYQIKRLTQELALLRQSAPTERAAMSVDFSAETRACGTQSSRIKENLTRDTLFVIWIIVCIGLYLLELTGSYPGFLLRFLSANYMQ